MFSKKYGQHPRMHVTFETSDVDCPQHKYGLVHDRGQARFQEAERRNEKWLLPKRKPLCPVFQKPVIIASCLHKEYAGQKKRCFSRRRKKTAVRNISFCVKKGLEQCLNLPLFLEIPTEHRGYRHCCTCWNIHSLIQHMLFWAHHRLFKNLEIYLWNKETNAW